MMDDTPVLTELRNLYSATGTIETSTHCPVGINCQSPAVNVRRPGLTEEEGREREEREKRTPVAGAGEACYRALGPVDGYKG